MSPFTLAHDWVWVAVPALGALGCWLWSKV